MLRKMFDMIAGFALWSVGLIVVVAGGYSLAGGMGLGWGAGPVAVAIGFSYISASVVVLIAEAAKRDWL